jgi:hypothetical protein
MPDQLMTPTQHFVVSFGSRRAQIFKVLGSPAIRTRHVSQLDAIIRPRMKDLLIGIVIGLCIIAFVKASNPLDSGKVA